ncbi:T9SS type A sorting domain-containing protein [Neolewinella persica]|uniref:T9SS type A sorting domain-containing protein n=1 Tax=Neolewinella persica TaxID=70998 RepID=UPI000362CFF2|nr:T9SS type A sorting domain-containing protein [Neolewinella persica]
MKIFTLLSVWLMLSLTLTAQTSYYVNQQTGDDGNSGTSVSTPFASIDPVFKGSNALVSPGDVVYLMGEFTNESYNGNYVFDYGGTPCDPTDDNINDPHIWLSENTINISNVHGTPGNYITIRPYDGSTILKGDGSNIFRVRNCSYLRIEDFEIRGEAFNISLQEAFALQFLFVDPNLYPDPDFSNLSRTQVSRYVDLCLSEAQVEALTFPGAATYPNGVPRPSYVDTRGMYLTDVHHVDIIGNNIQRMPGGGMRVARGEYVNIIDNEVAYNSLRSYTGTHGMVVTLAQSAISAGSDPNDDDTYRIKILRNRVHHNYNEIYSYDAKKTAITARIDEGKGISLQRNEASSWNNSGSRFLVANNLSYWNGFSGVHTNQGKHMDFINNTCYLNSYTNTETYVNPPIGVGYDPFSGYDPYAGYAPSGGNIGISAQNSEDIVIKNNISVIDGDLERFAISTDATNGIDDDGNPLVVENNLIFINDAGQLGNFREDSDITAIDERTIIADPQFTDALAEDFSLLAGSPAIGHADPAVAPAADFSEFPRDGAPDAGAFEAVTSFPVDLVSFTARRHGKLAALLNWTTMNERDNDYFSVERSSDGNTWLEIGQVMSRGNQGSVNGYALTDDNPGNGLNYYRLRQFDLNGSFSLSGVQVVNFVDENNLLVYPNPAQNWFEVIAVEDMENVRLLNAMGQDVTTQATIIVRDDRIKVGVSNLPRGVYFVRLGSRLTKVWIQ